MKLAAVPRRPFPLQAIAAINKARASIVDTRLCQLPSPNLVQALRFNSTRDIFIALHLFRRYGDRFQNLTWEQRSKLRSIASRLAVYGWEGEDGSVINMLPHCCDLPVHLIQLISVGSKDLSIAILVVLEQKKCNLN